MKLQKYSGFTLIEIMIVVGIIALLLGVTVQVMLRARINANQTSAQATLRNFATACESYAAANAALYPGSISDLTDPNPPYFSIDITAGSREGYSFSASFLNNGYSVVAEPLPNAGDWDYRVSTGVILERRAPGQNNWQIY